MSPSEHSLAAALRAASDEDLASLFAARRDLATPPPADTEVLATRAGTPGSIARAAEGLDTVTLAALEALVLLDADAAPVPAGAVDELTGIDARDAIATLRKLALVWGDDARLSLVPGAREVIGQFPADLGRPHPALDGVDIKAAIAELTDAERTLIGKLAAGPPIGKTRDAAADLTLDEAITPVQRLLARGLLLRRDAQTVELPRQIAVHLRGGRTFPASSLSEPALPTNPHSVGTVDSAAAGEAMELIRQVESLLQMWSQAPPPVLKAGGIGVREIRRVTKELDVDEPRAVLLAELVVGARLVADSLKATPEWVPTTLTDSWLASEPASRWATLAAAWLGLPRLPGLATTETGDEDRPPAPLSDRLHRPNAPAARRRVLDVLAELPPGTGIKDNEDLVGLLHWRAPRRGGRLAADTARWTLAEAAGTGLIALGALSTAARALLEAPGPGEPGDDERKRAVAAMTEALPTPVDHVLAQADLTVVAPGPLEPALAAEIAAVADVESAGHATVYRVSEASIRRALDGGRTADELHQLFSRRSATPVPQSLTYLIDDVARRHGRLRGGACASFLRCDDEVLLAEVLGNPATGELELRRIAPTVVVSPLPLAEVIDGLRALGYAPAAESADGRVVDLRPGGRRVQPRGGRRVAAAAGAMGRDQAEAAVARVRAGDRAAGARRGAGVRNAGGSGDTSATLALLSAAVQQRRQVWIGIVDANGTASQRIVTPVGVSAGAVESADGERYPLHRITSAAFVED